MGARHLYPGGRAAGEHFSAVILRCPECRTRRKDYGLFTQHLRESGHRVCICGGYHYAHRPGSPYCYSNPLSALLHADRQGIAGEDLVRCAQGVIEDYPDAEPCVRELLAAWKIDL